MSTYYQEVSLNLHSLITLTTLLGSILRACFKTSSALSKSPFSCRSFPFRYSALVEFGSICRARSAAIIPASNFSFFSSELDSCVGMCGILGISMRKAS